MIYFRFVEECYKLVVTLYRSQLSANINKRLHVVTTTAITTVVVISVINCRYKPVLFYMSKLVFF
jgi:hypothetical protein